MRRPGVVASVTLIATFAAVAVPGSAGPISARLIGAPSADLFDLERTAVVRGPVTTTYALDPRDRSAGAVDRDAPMFEPNSAHAPPPARPRPVQPEAAVTVVHKPVWQLDADVSWYGPGFYGKRTACGEEMTRSLVGVAHRTLPCGTLITFRNPDNGRTVTAPVVDRGPYVEGRRWDLTRGLCMRLDHCHTGPLSWRRARG